MDGQNDQTPLALAKQYSHQAMMAFLQTAELDSRVELISELKGHIALSLLVWTSQIVPLMLMFT